jgi:PadR family transcriptional regulator
MSSDSGEESDTSLPLLKGTLDVLILKTLSWGPMHGFGIAAWLESQSGGALGIDDSALYQSLHRLEGRRFVEAEWAVTENNRKARYYRLTRDGRQHLKREMSVWQRYSETVGAILAAQRV